MGTSGISECNGLVANTLQKHRWFFNTQIYSRKLADYPLSCQKPQSYFNLKYLIIKEGDEPRIYEMFQEYGRGKYKLVMSKLREEKFHTEEVSHMSKNVMEAYVNEDKDENFLNISLNYFNKQNLRQKAQCISEEELYEFLHISRGNLC